jgi:hypothetical protein
VIEAFDEITNGGRGLGATHLLRMEADTFREIQPHVTVGTSFDLLLGKIAQHGAAQGSVSEPRVQSAEERRERGDVMEIFGGIGLKRLLPELASGPSFVEGMIEKFVTGNARIKRVLKCLKIHAFPK